MSDIERIIEDFTEGLDNGAGAPGRLMRITGNNPAVRRHALDAIATTARNRGWTVLAETASGDDTASRLLDHATRLTRATVRDRSPLLASLNLRRVLSALLDQCEQSNTGALIIIDDAQNATEQAATAIATAVQHLIRDEADIALIIAGTTTMNRTWLNGGISFMRRAMNETLD